MAKLKILMATRTHMEKMMAMDHRVNSIYSYRLQTSQDPLGWGLTFQRVEGCTLIACPTLRRTRP